ncbi:acyl-CoA dehydrogenase family protein [Carboxydocella sp. JDF658]|uniref:acyl-CoA dehydrogenase family protein n=1 Tax=Carboxydocella sp. JDF658 TaxID=1926600 RepID=UPI0009C433CC|nr:acyl-CoA dehydrogenase family protein [Carboxydocella sp. JDF658]GAW31084.1 acyl-CoA dehydrogenase [Carboxydocella sp. JDF658]
MGERVKGGAFLLGPVSPEQVFTPEEFTEEHKMIAKTAFDFTAKEVEPRVEELEKLNPELMSSLLKQAGELGLLAADIPEEYDGAGLDKISSMLIAENLTRGGSFGLAHGAHTGIGSLPIVLFGNADQKKRYLPALASGEKIAAYCLTEPTSGSDALGAKTRADLSADGKYYILNGTKQFITNAGMADVFVVYAKVDGDKFTAFIVDRETEGLSLGPEEKKMGIKGSTTRQVILENAKVPVENVLGEIGKGHVIAFNILNIGRYKLAVGCLGAAKHAIELAAKYSLERKQFGKPIAFFGMIREKLARMATSIYVTESMVYRTGGLIDAALAEIDHHAEDAGPRIGRAIEEYALECSINKVFASEALDFVADEAVQIHGGYGYISEYPVERIYRDSRINRIFEGTNEINRLIIPGMLMRKAMKNELPFLQVAQALQKELLQPLTPVSDEPVTREAQLVERAKKIFLLAAGSAVQKLGQKLQDEQEILARIADLVIEIFAMESAVLRTVKKVQAKDLYADLAVAMTSLYCIDAFRRIEGYAREVLLAVEKGDVLATQLSALKKLTRAPFVDWLGLTRTIAAKVLDFQGYKI